MTYESLWRAQRFLVLIAQMLITGVKCENHLWLDFLFIREILLEIYEIPNSLKISNDFLLFFWKRFSSDNLLQNVKKSKIFGNGSIESRANHLGTWSIFECKFITVMVVNKIFCSEASVMFGRDNCYLKRWNPYVHTTK